ncbi:ketoreductase [Apiospora kogelbergensis]|uniref:ketoreductase n=1 Tax=Apiospora kogelbergensis TaxID=1337665 RepID=UPI00312D236E
MTEAKKTWLITGCSSGFGELFVRKLRAHWRRDSGLGCHFPAESIRSTLSEAWDLYPGGIDVLVNNAGYIVTGLFEELQQQEIEDVFKTNFHGPLNITRALLPKLREKGTGTLLYISSQAGWHADATATGYCATKHALEAAVECLSLELATFAPGIKVLLVEPGYFRTKAFSNINYVPTRNPDFAEYNSGVRAALESQLGKEPGDPDKAVSIMIDLVNGTGIAEGKDVPLRIPLGSDGWSRIKFKCEKMLETCQS